MKKILMMLAVLGIAQGASATCSINFKDTLNKTSAIITAEKSPGGYTVTVTENSKLLDSVDVTISGNPEAVTTNTGNAILRSQLNGFSTQMKLSADDKGQITIRPDSQQEYQVRPGATCTSEELNLIHYLNVEWFFYG